MWGRHPSITAATPLSCMTHHTVQLPEIMPSQRIERATKQLTAAIANAPTDGPPDYLDAVERLRRVFLGREKQQIEAQTQPASNARATTPKSPKVSRQSTAAPAIPAASTPAVTPNDADKDEPPELSGPNYVTDDEDSDDEDEEFDEPVRPRYNLRERHNVVAQNKLFEETPNVQHAESPCMHQGRFQQAAEVLRVQEAFKREMNTPIGMFVGAVVNPETGKALEYRDRRGQ